MANRKVEIGKTEDSRRTEKYVEEQVTGNTTERITTIMEEKVPMETKKVIKETIVPVMTTRKICEYQNGQVVNEVVEVVPDTTIKTVAGKPTINKEDLQAMIKEAVVAAVAGLQPQPVHNMSPVFDAPKIKDEPKKMAPARTMLAEKYEEQPTGVVKSTNLVDYGLYTVLAALAAGLLYFVVLKPFMG